MAHAFSKGHFSLARALVRSGIVVNCVEEIEKAFNRNDANAIKLSLASSQNARGLVRQVFNGRKANPNNPDQKAFFAEVDEALSTPLSLKSLCRAELNQMKNVPKRHWEGQVPESLSKFMEFDDFL